MIFLLSPSKTLDEKTPPRMGEFTQPALLAESKPLLAELKKYSPAKLATLMGISDKLAALNAQRYKDFTTPFTPKNAKQALLTFKGDVYTGIDVEQYTKADFAFAQAHMRILSGLYGVLRPLDLIQPYRLEMSIRLKNPRGKDLYQFWGERITAELNAALAQQKKPLLINLASEEYFKAVQGKKLEGELLNIVFKEKKGNQLKIIGLFAKQARGKMANFIVKHRIDSAAELKQFSEGGYRFEPELSNKQSFVFIR